MALFVLGPQTLCKDPAVRADVSTWRPAMLALGTVTFKLVKFCETTKIPKGLCVPAISEVVQVSQFMQVLTLKVAKCIEP